MLRCLTSVAAGRALLGTALGLGVGCAFAPPPPRKASSEPAPVERSAPAPPRELPPAAPETSAPGWPVQGPILSGFGAVRGGRHHEGIDIKAPRGTIVRAAAAGRVVESRWRRGYGSFVAIDHGDGTRTVYVHMAEVWVRVGARVEQGDAIATVGATGNATTPHLHFEVRRNGRLRNPLAWLGPPATVPASYPADRGSAD